MLATQRRSLLLTLFRENAALEVGALSKRLRVSEMTVRRDLDRLAESGRVQRVHGGAVAPEGLGFDSRMQVKARQKRQLVARLASTLPRTGTIYIDGSTTMFNLCEQIHGALDLHAVTNNLQTFRRLHGMPGVTALIVGGNLDPRTDNLVGALARRNLQSLHFDAAYFSCFGLHPETGAAEATLEDAEVKELAASRSARLYLAVDEAKLGGKAAGAWAFTRQNATLITSLPAASPKLKPFQHLFHQII